MNPETTEEQLLQQVIKVKIKTAHNSKTFLLVLVLVLVRVDVSVFIISRLLRTVYETTQYSIKHLSPFQSSFYGK